MAIKADVVRAVNQQFTGRIGEITDAVMARITDSNAKDILGPELAALMERGSIKSIVTFALYADALRVVRDLVVVDGVVSDDEIRDGLGIISVVIAAFAKVRPEYASYTPPSLENARKFLSHYQSDAGMFGYRNDATRWAGRALCRNIEATCKDSKPAKLLSEALMQWAEQIAAADGASPAEMELLGSLARVLDIPAASRNAIGVTPERSRTDGTPHDPATLIPPPKEVPPVGTVSTPSMDRPTKDCPFCGEAILAVAIKCKHCGEMLGDARPTAEPHALHHGSSTADRLKSADVTYPEIKRTCKKCGKVWFSDSEEEAWLEQSASTGHAIAGLQSLSAAFSGYGRAGGFNSVDSHQRNRMEAQSDDDKLGTMRRCPECLSRAYEEVKPPKPVVSTPTKPVVSTPRGLSADGRQQFYEAGRVVRGVWRNRIALVSLAIGVWAVFVIARHLAAWRAAPAVPVSPPRIDSAPSDPLFPPPPVGLPLR